MGETQSEDLIPYLTPEAVYMLECLRDELDADERNAATGRSQYSEGWEAQARHTRLRIEFLLALAPRPTETTP